MALGSPILFQLTPQTRFYMCRFCRNHVLSSENCIFEDIGMDAIICQNPVNVHEAVEDSFNPMFFLYPVVNVYCNGCHRQIACRFNPVAIPTMVIQDARFVFPRFKLLYWNGNQIVYADTEEPFEEK